MKRAIFLAIVGGAALAAAACSSPEQRLERYTKSGEEYLESGKLGMANVQFQNALKINSEHIPALLGVSRISERRADYDQMFAVLQRIHRIAPANRDANLGLAKLYLLANEPGKALALVDSVLAEFPDDAEAVASKASVMFRLQNYGEAVEFARRALSLDPLSQESVAVLAGARVHEKDYEGGLKIVEQAIARNSKAPVLHLLRVQILSDMGRDEDINQAYRTLINEYPNEANYRRLYVTALIEQEKLAEAREQLVKVAELLPRQQEAKLDVVRIDYRLGGAEKAKETFRRLINEAEEPGELEFALAAFLRQEGDFAAAERIYLDMISRDAGSREQVFKAKNEMAALRLMEDRRPEAEQLIDEVLAADNRNPDALLKRAGLKIDDGELEEAVADLRIILNDRPDFVSAKLLMATAYEQKKDYSLAESEMAQAVAASGRAPQPSNIFAKFLLRRNQPDRAAKVLTDSLGVDPTDVENLKLLASIRLQQQDWRGAEQVANALKTANDQDEIVSRILGAAYTGLQDYAGAIDVLVAEHERAPLGTGPLSNLIEAYVDAGRGLEAETFLKKTIEKTPDNYDARILLAQVEIYNKRVYDAKETLRAAIDADPLRPEAYESLYQIYAIEGRRQDAGSVIEQAVASIPDNDGLQVLQADNLIALGRGEDAIPIYERILARRPGDQIISNNLASLLAMRDDAASLARAKSVAEVLKDSENAYFLDTYGWAAFRGGDRTAGIDALKKAVIAAPDLVDARYHLGVALVTVGETDRGRAELETVIKAPGAQQDLVDDARRLLNQ